MGGRGFSVSPVILIPPRSHLVVVHELGDAQLLLVVLHVKLDVLVGLPLLVCQRVHCLPDARDQDLTTGADQRVYTPPGNNTVIRDQGRGRTPVSLPPRDPPRLGHGLMT